MTETSAPEHFKVETDSDNIAWLHFDMAGAGTNVLGIEVLEQLDLHLPILSSIMPSNVRQIERGLQMIMNKGNRN